MQDATPEPDADMLKAGFVRVEGGGFVVLAPPLTPWGWAHRLPEEKQAIWLREHYGLRTYYAVVMPCLLLGALMWEVVLPNRSVTWAWMAGPMALILGPPIYAGIRDFRVLERVPLSRSTLVHIFNQGWLSMLGGLVFVAFTIVMPAVADSTESVTCTRQICMLGMALMVTFLAQHALCWMAMRWSQFLPTRTSLITALAGVEIVTAVGLVAALLRG